MRVFKTTRSSDSHGAGPVFIRRTLLWPAAVFLIAACTPRTPRPAAGGFGHMMYYGYSGMFMWLLFLIIAGMLIYFVVTKTRIPLEQDDLSPETPLDILKKRYARGEIDKETFDRLKRDLES